MGKTIGVIGTGAVGASVGSCIAGAGENIVLVDPWKENVDVMNRDGVFLEDSVKGNQRFKVRALHTDALDQLEGKLDILLVSVKSYNTEWAVKTMLPHLTDEALVVSVQNSINEEIIASIVGPERTLGCVVQGNVQMMEPAHVVVTRSITQSAARNSAIAHYLLGEMEGPVTPRVRELVDLFEHVGSADGTDNLKGLRWYKLITNCLANPVCGASGLVSSEAWKNPGLRRVSTVVTGEAVKVGLKLGYSIPSVMGELTVEEAIASAEGRSSKMDDLLLSCTERVHERSMPSLMQDVLKGRRTEVDYLNGLVVRKASGTGVGTPVNEGIVALVHEIERGKVPPNPDSVARLVEGL